MNVERKSFRSTFIGKLPLTLSDLKTFKNNGNFETGLFRTLDLD